MDGLGEFDITVGALDDAVVVTVTGDIDMFTAPRLRDALHTAQRTGAAAVLLDLSQVPFVDSSALGAMTSAHRELESAGRRLALVAPQPNVLRVFELTQLSRVIAIHPSMAAAAAG